VIASGFESCAETFFSCTGRGLFDVSDEPVVGRKWFSDMTDDERTYEAVRMITEALRLSDTHRLAVVHYLLGLVAMEASRELATQPDPPSPTSVVSLRRPPAPQK
jgi:hypothetical protein